MACSGIPKPKKVLVQVRNPKTGLFLALDRAAGRIVSHKSTPGPYKNIKILGLEPWNVPR